MRFYHSYSDLNLKKQIYYGMITRKGVVMEMVFKISKRDKQDFLKWFLKNYSFNSRENTWLLEMLLNQPEVLEQVNFVKSINNCPRTISMSTVNTNEPEFIFTKNNLITIDQHKAYHDLRLNVNDPIYIKLNYPGQEKCHRYSFISIDNPFDENDFLIGKDRYIANQNLDSIAQKKTIKLIKEKINNALDHNKKDEFYYFSNELIKIESENLK